MNSQITKKFLRKLLSDFYRRLFPLALLSSKGSEISILRFHTDRAGEWPHETQVYLSGFNSHITKRFLRWLCFFKMRLFVVSELHRVSYCRFCDNSARKLLSENNDGHLWAEVRHNKEVSEKAFLQFLWKLHSPFSRSIFPLSFSSSNASEIALLRIHGKSPRQRLQQRVV